MVLIKYRFNIYNKLYFKTHYSNVKFFDSFFCFEGIKYIMRKYCHKI